MFTILKLSLKVGSVNEFLIFYFKLALVLWSPSTPLKKNNEK